MPKKLELNFSSKQDEEIIRYLQLNTDSNTSPIFICAIEYFLKTNQYLNIGSVCLDKLGSEEIKMRKPIYVPQKSPVEEWSDNLKQQRRGLLSAKVRHILKNSIKVVPTEDMERVEGYVDCMMMVEDAETVPIIRTIVEPKHSLTPQEELKSTNISTQSTQSSIVRMAKPSQDNRQPFQENIQHNETQKKGSSIMDKLMPIWDEDD